jgi:hypothetical protein
MIESSAIFPLPGPFEKYQIFSLYAFGDIRAAKESYRSSNLDKIESKLESNFANGTTINCYVNKEKKYIKLNCSMNFAIFNVCFSILFIIVIQLQLYYERNSIYRII